MRGNVATITCTIIRELIDTVPCLIRHPSSFGGYNFTGTLCILVSLTL